MTGKRVVVSASGEDTECTTARTAIALAKRLDVALDMLHIVPDYQRFRTSGIGLGARELEAFKDKQIERSGPARLKCLALAEKAGVIATWRSAVGVARDLLLDESVSAEMTVVDRRDSSVPSAAIPHGLGGEIATESAKPVVVTPGAAPFDDAGSRILVAWNATKESQRAVMDALPLLRRADQIEAVQVLPAGLSGIERADRGQRLEQFLDAHGIAVTCRNVNRDGESAAAQLLEEAHRMAANLIVMGAYGHSRMRELIFGGMTAHMLGHASVPVMLSN